MGATTAAVDSFSKNQKLLKRPETKIKNHSLNKRRTSPQRIQQLIPNFPFQITPVVCRSRKKEDDHLL